jgi:hypothetical protein
MAMGNYVKKLKAEGSKGSIRFVGDRKDKEASFPPFVDVSKGLKITDGKNVILNWKGKGKLRVVIKGTVEK